MVGPAALAEFLPIDVDPAGRIQLLWVGAPPHPEPFLGETIDRCRESGPSLTIDVGRLIDAQPVQFRPFIVSHCGRTGSTLLSVLFDACPSLVTFREPTLIASILESEALRSVPGLLRAVVDQHAWAAASVGRRAVIKLPSHSIHTMGPLLRGASDPVVLVRTPVAVVERMLVRPPWWLLIELRELGLVSDAMTVEQLRGDLTLVAHVASQWNRFADVVLELVPHCALIAYDDLVEHPEHTLRRCLDHFQVDDTLPDLREIMSVDAKSGVPWSGGPAPEPSQLSPSAAELVRAVTDGNWQRIEAALGRELVR